MPQYKLIFDSGESTAKIMLPDTDNLYTLSVIHSDKETHDGDADHEQTWDQERSRMSAGLAYSLVIVT